MNNPGKMAGLSKWAFHKQRFAEDILIPEAVWWKVVDGGGARPGAGEVRAANWIQQRSVRDRDYVRLLCAELDTGEAEAIVLARQEQTDVVLLDEKEARRVASRLGMHVLGTVGLLIWAGRQELIPSLSEQLKTLQEEGGFRRSQELCLAPLRFPWGHTILLFSHGVKAHDACVGMEEEWKKREGTKVDDQVF